MLRTFGKHVKCTVCYVALQNKLAHHESDIWSLVCGGAMTSPSLWAWLSGPRLASVAFVLQNGVLVMTSPRGGGGL